HILRAEQQLAARPVTVYRRPLPSPHPLDHSVGRAAEDLGHARRVDQLVEDARRLAHLRLLARSRSPRTSARTCWRASIRWPCLGASCAMPIASLICACTSASARA